MDRWPSVPPASDVNRAFPILTAALFGLLGDRQLGMHIFDPANGGAILWQHMFWFFGHPEVYIVALPYFGIVSEIFPVFSRKPCFGYKGLVFATLTIAALSAAVWAHHMFATGAVLLPFFSFMTFLIAVPTGVKFFNWIGTMWKGQLTFETPMLWSLGFLVTFLFGGPRVRVWCFMGPHAGFGTHLAGEPHFCAYTRRNPIQSHAPSGVDPTVAVTHLAMRWCFTRVEDATVIVGVFAVAPSAPGSRWRAQRVAPVMMKCAQHDPE